MPCRYHLKQQSLSHFRASCGGASVSKKQIVRQHMCFLYALSHMHLAFLCADLPSPFDSFPSTPVFLTLQHWFTAGRDSFHLLVRQIFSHLSFTPCFVLYSLLPTSSASHVILITQCISNHGATSYIQTSGKTRISLSSSNVPTLTSLLHRPYLSFTPN